MNKVCIATLTHNLGERHICLYNTVTSLLDNTHIPFIIDWYIHSNGITQEILDVVHTLQDKYKDKANIIFSHSDLSRLLCTASTGISTTRRTDGCVLEGGNCGRRYATENNGYQEQIPETVNNMKKNKSV